jgi:hypothetical protein
MGTELFAPTRRHDKVRELVAHVARLARVNVGRVAFTTSLNLVSCTIFSRDLTSLDDHSGSTEFQEVVTDIMEAVGRPNVSDFFPALARADLQGVAPEAGAPVCKAAQDFRPGDRPEAARPPG